MVRFLPPVGPEPPAPIDEPTPRQIVQELDRYVVGQDEAKRAVAVALRNRVRRLHLEPGIAEEIAPRNIIMIGPTGVGKTEIARRLARMSRAPFVKVEASKFTEVGYVGRDVDSMVRDLVEVSVDIVREELVEDVRDRAEQNAENRLLDLLLPEGIDASADVPDPESGEEAVRRRSREKLRGQLRKGELDDRTVDLDVREPMVPFLETTAGPFEELDANMAEMLRSAFGYRSRTLEMLVPQALEHLVEEEEENLVDPRQVARLAVERAEDYGIIFVDEIDKVTGSGEAQMAEVSREGVQRDLLPLLDGSSVHTRYGTVRTDHILFIAAGAFQDARPNDLIPELQGRFPVRVELDPLSVDDLQRILTEPETAILKHYCALIQTEGIRISFRKDAIRTISEVAARMNDRMEDIGARRLQTILERILNEIMFDAPEVERKEWEIDADYVNQMLEGVVEDEDLSRFIT